MGNQSSGFNKDSGQRTKRLALTGMLSALIVIALVLESIAPTGRLGFYVLAAFILSVILMETGIKWAWISYIATCLLGLLIVPEKLNVLPYVLFFGIYTMLKYHIESIRKVWVEIIIKLAVFNAVLWPSWALTKTFLPETLTKGNWVILAGFILQLLFIGYDVLFTFWVRYYFEKIVPRLRKAG
jgi:hypothetical protein